MEFYLKKSLALSLSDSFWMKPKDSDLTWEKVNFFDNEFSDDIGEFLVTGEGTLSSLMSPSNTTDGMFPKKWIIVNGQRLLVKQGDVDFRRYDHLSEIFATKLLQILCRRSRTKYAVYFYFGKDLCATPCFVIKGQNLVTAYRFLMEQGIDPDNAPKSGRYYPITKPFGSIWVDAMLILDFIVFNKDRHLGNFGFMQDATTGKLLYPAPIYDTGMSIFAAIDRSEIKQPDYVFDARTFASEHKSQLSYVASLKSFKTELEEIQVSLKKIFYNVFAGIKLEEFYLQQMEQLLQKRVEYLLKLCK
jgi:hypothetical protein